MQQFQTAGRGQGPNRVRVSLQVELVEHIGEAKQQLPLVLMGLQCFAGQQQNSPGQSVQEMQLISFSGTVRAAAPRTPLRNGISLPENNYAGQYPFVLHYNLDLDNLVPHSALFRQLII